VLAQPDGALLDGARLALDRLARLPVARLDVGAGVSRLVLAGTRARHAAENGGDSEEEAEFAGGLDEH
jgi:hypothetical protein